MSIKNTDKSEKTTVYKIMIDPSINSHNYYQEISLVNKKRINMPFKIRANCKFVFFKVTEDKSHHLKRKSLTRCSKKFKVI